MRANEPVYRDQINDLWAVTRHADIRDVEGRPTEFVSSEGYRSFHSPGETNMIAQDDPRHLDQRKLVARRFTPKAVRAHEPWLRTTVAGLVDQMIAAVRDGADGVEVVDAVAAQLPCRLTASLLGWDEARWRDIKSWSERLMRYDAIRYDQDAMVGMMEAILAFNPELQTMAEERRGCPMDDDSDLITVWANADHRRRAPRCGVVASRDGSVHLRGRGDDAHLDRPWPAGVLRSSRPMGGHGREPGSHP